MTDKNTINKIIFLDCDGVINHNAWYKSNEYYNNEFIDPDIDPKVIERLNKLTDEFGIKIVISSSWKIDDYCVQRLEKAGLKNIIDVTPNLIFSCSPELYSRGLEIDAWLMNHPGYYKYLILDDMMDFNDDQKECFLLVDYQVGLTDDDITYCKYWFK